MIGTLNKTMINYNHSHNTVFIKTVVIIQLNTVRSKSNCAPAIKQTMKGAQWLSERTVQQAMVLPLIIKTVVLPIIFPIILATLSFE